MAKISKKKRNEPVTINTIYELLKNRNTIQTLWLEIIADIGNKPTYKRIKEKVRCVINGTLTDFDTEPADNSELLRRRGIFTEISIMSYTVDRVLSEFLYRRLQNEFKSMIGNMLEELQIEKNAKIEASPVKINSMFENIESIFANKEPISFEGGTTISVRKKCGKAIPNRSRPILPSTPAATKSEESLNQGSVNNQPVESNQRQLRKRGRPKKYVATSSSDSSSSKNVETSEKSDGSDNFQPKDSDLDSNLTFDSLSSVHTNDLSSFDDNVSICMDDGKNGRKKKQVPLKKASTMILEGRLPDIYKVKTDVEINKRKRESVLRKVLPQRKMKPNSKYNAETMYCQVKDYSSLRSSPISDDPSDEDSSSEAVNEPTSAESEVHQEAKRAKISNNKSEHSSKVSSSPTKPVTTRSLHKGTPTKGDLSQNMPSPTSSSTPLKNSAQRYTPSDLYKPRFHFGSSCNNRNATSLTVFS